MSLLAELIAKHLGEKPTFWHGLRIRHVHGQLHRPMAGDSSLRNEARRHSDDAALGQLTAPPVCSQKLQELAIRVYGLVLDSGVGQEVCVEHG